MLDAGPIPGAARPSARSVGWGALLVAVAAVFSFGYRLAEEPRFVDEMAMFSQSYFADLLVEGDRDNPAWLEYPGYDSSPLPKYLIGLVLRVAGHRRPGPAEARSWFFDTSRHFDLPGELVLARWPFAIGAAFGCVAIYALGVLARDRKVGLLAALMLMINPLYRLHARRAMADVLVEAFILSCLALMLWTWRRVLEGKSGPAVAIATVLAGVSAALAALAKLNGLLALVIVAAWVALALGLPGIPIRRRLAFAPAALVAAVVAFVTFVAFNPFLTARPRQSVAPPLGAIAELGFWSRARLLIVHRTEVAREQMQIFPHNALTTPVEKIKAAAVQGYGRFGLFGPRTHDPLASTRRYDWAQDWGALLWLPWVGAGLAWALARGRHQWASGVPPTGWALAVAVIVTGLVVTAYLPLAWDRYLLSLQPGSAILAAGIAVAAADRLVGAISRRVDGARPVRILRRPESWVFVILLGSYAFLWHSRDWNSASRLMLTYSLVDRGTITLDGLEKQTGDIAFFRHRYFTDKLPGFSLLATAPYALAKGIRGLPAHPLNRPAFAHWEADYWVTLGTSGLLTALSGVILARLARDLGCGPRRAALVGLSYGLATPAYVYATMSYGHQASAFALLAAFALIWRAGRPHPAARMVAAGFLASFAAVIELSVGPISAILGFYLIAQVIGRKRPASAMGAFTVGATVPALVLLGYNELAFGSPLDMGYFHHATAIFARVHNPENPLGLMHPDWSKAIRLLWGGYRGLFFYAPILALSIPGWIVLAARRLWGMALVSFLVVAAVFLVNLSYPEWTGGWSTGPRLLVPLLPFAMLPVAAVLAAGGRAMTLLAIVLSLGGGVLNLLFQGAGARLPQYVADPLLEAVLPAWRGSPLPLWWIGDRFTRNLVSMAFPDLVRSLPERLQWVQFLPLVAFQAMGIIGLCLMTHDDAARSDRGMGSD